AVDGQAFLRLLEVLAGVQQRLARDAAHVHARAAQRRVLLDAGRSEAELRGADRGHVSTGSAPDDDEVEAVVGHQTASSMRSGSSRRSFTRTRNVTACWPSI